MLNSIANKGQTWEERVDNMKKLLVVLLMLAAMAFTACGQNDEPDTPAMEDEVIEETVGTELPEETQNDDAAEEADIPDDESVSDDKKTPWISDDVEYGDPELLTGRIYQEGDVSPSGFFAHDSYYCFMDGGYLTHEYINHGEKFDDERVDKGKWCIVKETNYDGSERLEVWVRYLVVNDTWGNGQYTEPSCIGTYDKEKDCFGHGPSTEYRLVD